MDPIELVRLAEGAEIAGWTSMFKAPPPDFRAATGMAVEEFGDGVVGLVCKAIPIPLFNRVMGMGVWADAGESLLDAINDRYRMAAVHSFALQLCPAARLGAIEERIRQRGFKRGGDWAKCVRGSRPPATIQTTLRVEPASADNRATYAQTIGESFGMPASLAPFLGATVDAPDWRSYLSYDRDEPVGCGALHIENGVGWLGGGGTIPAARKRGSQGAVMARRLADGVALGCTRFVTETGAETPEQPNPSLHNMLRAGFELAYLRTDWLSPGG